MHTPEPVDDVRGGGSGGDYQMQYEQEPEPELEVQASNGDDGLEGPLR